MSDHRHPFADERFSERWPSAADWEARRFGEERQRRREERRRRVDAGEHEGTTPRGNPEREEDKIRPRSEEYERVLGH